ncbi:hypothetical protein HH213_17140 [Duganella dendranthematis]|uniref:Uncharacterized protein n=1 Tax=Duganella dendranthematis TaxID=2728021 RepID=A0ABX6MBE7_9BURK|nr:hypothetical protein [Duganella dendranthematis]QJD91659.1 hypothetical protein HH213_17140 [Duganella dendranthematis]
MSQKPSRVQIVKNLISSAIPGGTLEHDGTYRGFGCGISIPYDTAIQYVDALTALYEEEKTIAPTLTLESFEQRVAPFIADYVLSKTEVQTAEVTAFLQEILSLPVSVHDVFRPISGITMTKGGRQLR